MIPHEVEDAEDPAIERQCLWNKIGYFIAKIVYNPKQILSIFFFIESGGSLCTEMKMIQTNGNSFHRIQCIDLDITSCENQF